MDILKFCVLNYRLGIIFLFYVFSSLFIIGSTFANYGN